MAAPQLGQVPCECAQHTMQARCVKALQHGKAVSSASGSDDGARRQIDAAIPTLAAAVLGSLVAGFGGMPRLRLRACAVAPLGEGGRGPGQRLWLRRGGSLGRNTPPCSN